MRRKKKEKKEVPTLRKTPGRKKLPDRKEEEARKTAETMGKMMNKWKEVDSLTVEDKGRLIVDNIVQIDRKTVAKHDERKEDPKAVGRKEEAQRTPRRKFQAVLRRFSTTDKVEETFEEWKKRKELVKKGEKRKAGSDDMVNLGAVTGKGTPGKIRKIDPEKPKDKKSGN